MTIAELKAELVRHFTGAASYRDEVADRLPWPSGKAKNSNYAESLMGVVAHVESLPDDDPVLRELADAFGENDISEALEAAHDRIIHCGQKGWALDAAGCRDWFTGFAKSLRS
jgi:hypothetical protein